MADGLHSLLMVHTAQSDASIEQSSLEDICNVITVIGLSR